MEYRRPRSDCAEGPVVALSDFPFLQNRSEITSVSSWVDSYEQKFWDLMAEAEKTQGTESWLFKRTIAAMNSS